MNKKILAMAVVGAFAASGTAFAGKGMGHGPGAKVHGHVFSTFALTNDSIDTPAIGALGALDQVPGESVFHTDAEINIRGEVAENVYAAVDLDYNPSIGDDGIEQAYGIWKAHDMVKVQIGRFNNPLGIEAHDQAELSTMITHGLIRTVVLNSQIVEGDGNNIEGVAAHLMAGPAKVTVGFLNEIAGVPEENSMLLNIGASPVDGLDLGLGVITQDGDTGARFGNLINFNAAFGMMMENEMSWKASLDFITADEGLDNGISLAGHLGLPMDFGVAARYDMVEFDGGAENTAITLAGSWQATDNFDLRLEWRNDEIENGASVDGDSITMAAAFLF